MDQSLTDIVRCSTSSSHMSSLTLSLRLFRSARAACSAIVKYSSRVASSSDEDPESSSSGDGSK